MSLAPQWSKPKLPVGLPGAAYNALDALHLGAYVAYMVGDCDEAAKLLDKLIRSHPNESAYHFDLGLVRWKAGAFAAAATAFLRAGGIDASFADAFYNAGVAELQAGNRTVADQHFRTGRQSDSLLAFQGLIDTFRGLIGRPQVLLERYGWRIPTKEFPGVLDVIAFNLMERGKYDEAAAFIRRAMAMEKTAERHVALGTLLKKMEKFEEASREFDTALRIDPVLRMSRVD